jgi:hypothetical protein
MKTASREEISPKRLRVLVVEDEMLSAMLVEDSLVDFGCDVVGPVGPAVTREDFCPSSCIRHQERISRSSNLQYFKP